MTVGPVTRRAAAALLTAVAVLSTSACGDGDDAKAGDQPSTAPTTAAVLDTSGLPPVERGAYPVRIKHTWNQAGTVIETEPKRIVVLGMREQDTMTAMGVYPLTIRNYFGSEHPWPSFPWLSDAQKDHDYKAVYYPTRDSKTGKVSVTTEGPVLANGYAQASNSPERKEVFDYDAIKAMNPDLIVAMYAGIVLEDYQKLSDIAPTVTMVSSDSKDYFSSWQEETLALGRILGRTQYSRDKVAEISQKFIDAYTEHPELKNASVAVVAPGPNGTYRLMNPYSPMSRFFTSIGMEFPGRIESATRYTGVSRKMYGIETGNLSFVDGVDALVWIVGHDGREAMDRIKKSSAYQNLRVVKSNKVLELGPNEAEALYYSSITSLPWAIDQLTPKLVALLGDKAARDRLAERQAEAAAAAEGDLAINYDPTATPKPEPTGNPYEDLMNGTEPSTEPSGAPAEATEEPLPEATPGP